MMSIAPTRSDEAYSRGYRDGQRVSEARIAELEAALRGTLSILESMVGVYGAGSGQPDFQKALGDARRVLR